MISMVFVLIGIIIYLRLNKFYQFTVLSLAALLPLSFGNFGSIPNLLFIEWLTVVTLLTLINELNPVYSFNKRLRVIKYKGIEIFIFAVIILATLLIYNIIQNEFVTNKLIQNRTRGTLRLYFGSFNNILLFFTTIIFVATYYSEINFEKLFKIILYVAIFLGVLRILSYFMKFDIPFLYGLFRYTSNPMKEYGGIAYRLSGLDTVSIVGIPAYFACYIFKRKINLIILSLFFVFVFLSGGRSVMAGVITSVILFSFLFFRRNFIYLIMGGGLFLLFFIIFVPDNVLQGQISRITTLNAGHFFGQDAWRGLAWTIYLDNFSKSPIVGIGIGAYRDFVYSSFPDASQFNLSAQFAGGHGSYLSLMSIFGLAGLVYFVILVWGGIILSFRKIKQYTNSNQSMTSIAVFCFLLLIIESIDWITAENGLDIPILFFTVGFVASLTVLQNINQQNNYTASSK